MTIENEKEKEEKTEEKETKPKSKTKTVKKAADKEIKTKAKEDLFVEFTVKIKNREIEKNFDEALLNYAEEIKLPGFRKGKAPLEVVRSRLKDSIRAEVIGKMLQEAIFKKIQEDKLKIVSEPKIQKIDSEEGKDATAKVMVEVMPEVNLPDLEAMEVEIPAKDLEIEPYDEQKAIDRVLMANQRQAPVTGRGIKDNDMVTIKYQTKNLETKRMERRKDSYYMVVKDSPSEILELYDAIFGKKTGDKLTIKRKYPADFKKKIWAGKEMEHTIDIDNVYEMAKPDLDETFIKAQGFKDEAEFKKKLHEQYQEYSKQQQQDKKVTAVIDKLSETVDFLLPQTLVEAEMSRMAQQNPYQFQNSMELLKTNAEKSVRFSFIVQAVTDKYNLKVVTDELNKEYISIAEHNRLDVKEVRNFYSKKENREQLEDQLLRQKVVALLKEKIKVKEV